VAGKTSRVVVRSLRPCWLCMNPVDGKANRAWNPVPPESVKLDISFDCVIVAIAAKGPELDTHGIDENPPPFRAVDSG
jgi:hypothetical protein